jgi:hypothetical protein
MISHWAFAHYKFNNKENKRNKVEPLSYKETLKRLWSLKVQNTSKFGVVEFLYCNNA